MSDLKPNECVPGVTMDDSRSMTDDERRSADDYLMRQFEVAKSSYEQEYKLCWDVCEAVNAYLNCDGSNGRYDSLKIEECRKKLRQAVKSAMTPNPIELVRFKCPNWGEFMNDPGRWMCRGQHLPKNNDP